MGVIKRIVVSAEDRVELERIVRAVSSEVRLVERADRVGGGGGVEGQGDSGAGGVLGADGGEVARPLRRVWDRGVA